jgi:hypothetical protein
VRKALYSILITAAGFAFATTATGITDGLALMKVEPGARPAGLAGAFVSVAADPMAAAYNPAGAAGMERFSVSFGHISYWENIRLETGYFAGRLMGNLYFHGGVRYAAVSDLESRLVPSAEPQAFFDAHDVSFKLGLAYRFSERLSAGLAAGWLTEKIGAYDGSTFNVDLGLVARPTANISIGLSAVNLGPDFQLTNAGLAPSGDISPPTTYRLGGSYRRGNYLGALDVVVLDDETHVHLGVEGEVYENLVVRSGYMSGYDSKNFTAGVSFHVPRYRVIIDYAFVPYYNDLGSSHLFSLTLGL